MNEGPQPRPGFSRTKYEPPGGGASSSPGSKGSSPPPGGTPPPSGNNPPPGSGAGRATSIKPTIHVWTDPALIARREFLYGRHLIRKYVSATLAPGAAGKSSLLIADAIAMASGKNLLGTAPFGQLRVWYWNGEDPRDEILRRVAATCLHHNIGENDIGDRLFYDSGRDLEVIIATQNKQIATLNKDLQDKIVESLVNGKFDVLIIDPFITAHRVNENDNMGMDVVTKAFGRIAERANCAVELVHHVRKIGAGEVTVESGRGASAIIAAARSVRTLNTMTETEAKDAGIETEKRRAYFREDIGKANVAAPSDKALWRKFTSVSLGNGVKRDREEDDLAWGYPDESDHVGVPASWEWPKPLDGVTLDDLDAARAEIRKHGPWRLDGQATNWVGIPIAVALKLDPSDRAAKRKIKGLIKIWIQNGALRIVDMPDARRKMKPHVVVA
jgi:hypothetical protein